MKKIISHISNPFAIGMLCIALIVSVAYKPQGEISLKTKVSIFAFDTSKRQIEFTSNCNDCGPIFIYMDGKYAGQIDIKFRDRTIIVKDPGSYTWKAKTESGLTEEGTVDCP